MANWYEIHTELAHQGAGRYYDGNSYVWASGIIDALNKYHSHVRGVKKRFTPNVRELTSEESKALEARIKEEGVRLERAKSKCFYGTKIR